MTHVGIHAISYYTPGQYLPIASLAAARNIEYPKLNKGLGLESMGFPDIDEDAASMGANAVWKLFEQESLDPSTLGRLYLGTESAVDAAKPTATYIHGMLESKLEDTFGPRSLKHCDVVDLTFACVGAVDALENAVQWVRTNPTRKAIVLASDMAKYSLESTGEYTQGAGAVALLITANPAIINLGEHWGVATKGERDFFKPRRTFEKAALLREAAELLGVELDATKAAQLQENAGGFWGGNTQLRSYVEEPVFDGPYSNDAYVARMQEALQHLSSLVEDLDPSRWDRIVMHLPYAFQGRRMLVNFYLDWMKEAGQWSTVVGAMEGDKPTDVAAAKEWVRAFSKTPHYRAYVAKALAPAERASAQIGNMYTASIFMGLLSTLVDGAEQNLDLEGAKIGFMGYGSGSKAKVFEGTVAAGWKKITSLGLFEDLEERTAVDMATYEDWHNEKLRTPIHPNKTGFVLAGRRTALNQEEYRDYTWRA